MGASAKVTYIQHGEHLLAAFEVEIYKSPFLPSLHRLLQTRAGFHAAHWAVRSETGTQLLQVPIVHSKLS